jgi:hypothetical protein
MKMPSEEQIKEVKESLDDIFNSIEVHKGLEFAMFVHAMVSLKQMCEGIHVLGKICKKHEDNFSEEEKLLASTFLSIAPDISVAAFSKFAIAAKFNDEQANEVIEWAERIESQMDKAARALMK